MVVYIGKIVDEIESIETNLFDGSTDTILLDIEKAEDAAFQDADKGIQILAVRDDSPPTAKGAAGDYMPLLVDATGQLYIVDEAVKSSVSILDGVSSAVSTAVTCGASSVTVLTSSATRKFAVFVNDSDEAIYLKLGSGATLHSGIRLNANGGAYEINATNLYTGIVTAIATNATKVLTVTSG